MHLHGNNYERIAAMKKELPTVEYLRKTIRYDAKTGKMYWLKRTNEHYPPKTANIEDQLNIGIITMLAKKLQPTRTAEVILNAGSTR